MKLCLVVALRLRRETNCRCSSVLHGTGTIPVVGAAQSSAPFEVLML